jgi:hypothetical protein
MFKISSKASYKWPVVVHMPQDGGTYAKHSFNAEFKYLDQDQIDKVFDNASNGRDNGDLAAEGLIGWDGVNDQDGNVLEFNEDNKAMLLRIPYIRSAVVSTFVESIYGNGGRRKN